MKLRRFFKSDSPAAQTPAPPVPAPENPEAEYAKAIAQTILQGMKGDDFALVVQMMDARAIKAASQYSLTECIEWFKRDPEARRILESTPGFDNFAAAFHKKACELGAAL